MDFLLTTLRILQVAFGIGLVIFVHEAGHYFAARLCRVRVDVFSLGFGPRLFGWRRGATTYQLAAVPFGGYVKMAGEDPTERDRPPRPDELLAKSPLQRFFIYSGGVLMNMLFAFVALPLVLLAGVPQSMPMIGEPADGSPAWHARLEAGTRFHSINGTELYDFGDVANEIALNGDAPARIELTRPGAARRETITIRPEYDELSGIYQIGVGPAWDPDLELRVQPGSAAARAGVRDGDRLLDVEGWTDALPPARALTHAAADGAPITLRLAGEGGERTVTVTPDQVEGARRLLGLQPGRLVVEAVRAGGLAEELGFQQGDALLALGGRTVRTLPEVLPALLAALGAPRFELARGDAPLAIDAPPLDEARAVALLDDLAIGADETSTVLAIVPGSAAEEAGVRAGDRIVALDGEPVPSYAEFLERTKSAREGGDAVTLTLARDAEAGAPETITVTIAPRDVPFPDYGLSLEPAEYVWRVPSVRGAIVAGCASAVRLARTVWLTLKKMGSGEVSSRNMGGIITIGVASHSFAVEGWAKLFFFLSLLSINLAFLNVLPIPILDGGHLFFLLIEMIKGSPVSERTLGYSQIVGLVLIVSLMVYVTYNDVMRLLGPG